MPFQPLPKTQLRARYFSDQVRAWKDSPDRTPEQCEAFDRALVALKEGDWATVDLAGSLAFNDCHIAAMASGEFILVRFSMRPPLPAVELLFVGAPHELAVWEGP